MPCDRTSLTCRSWVSGTPERGAGWRMEICRSYLVLHISAAIKQYVFFGSDLPTPTPAYLASPGRLRNPIPNRNRKSLAGSAGDVCASTKINVDAFSITTLAAYKFGVKRNRS